MGIWLLSPDGVVLLTHSQNKTTALVFRIPLYLWRKKNKRTCCNTLFVSQNILSWNSKVRRLQNRCTGDRMRLTVQTCSCGRLICPAQTEDSAHISLNPTSRCLDWTLPAVVINTLQTFYLPASHHLWVQQGKLWNGSLIHYSAKHWFNLEEEINSFVISYWHHERVLTQLRLFSFPAAGADLPHVVQLHLHGDLRGRDVYKGEAFWTRHLWCIMVILSIIYKAAYR